MNEPLDLLPGEGQTRVQTRRRHKCFACGRVAQYKVTFLRPDARRNPLSSAYGKDDCTWCEDERQFCCSDHLADAHRDFPDWEPCSTFPATATLAHMFLYWE